MIILLKWMFGVVLHKATFWGAKVMLVAVYKERIVQNRLQLRHLFTDAG